MKREGMEEGEGMERKVKKVLRKERRERKGRIEKER